MLAILCGEPWCLTPEQVGKLTPYQVSNVYFRERDSRGELIRKQTPGKSYEERFRDVWARRGLPGWRVEELWQAHLKKAAARRSGR